MPDSTDAQQAVIDTLHRAMQDCMDGAIPRRLSFGRNRDYGVEIEVGVSEWPIGIFARSCSYVNSGALEWQTRSIDGECKQA